MAAAAQPHVLCLVTALQDFIIQVREAHNFGLAPQVALVQPWGLGVEELAHIDVKHRQNLWTGTNGYYTNPNPVSAKFTEAHEKKFGLPPGYAAVAAYGMTRLVLRGIERAKSAEPVEVIKAFKGWETEDWPGTVRINPQTHQTERNYFFLRCKRQMTSVSFQPRSVLFDKGVIRRVYERRVRLALGMPPMPAHVERRMSMHSSAPLPGVCTLPHKRRTFYPGAHHSLPRPSWHRPLPCRKADICGVGHDACVS